MLAKVHDTFFLICSFAISFKRKILISKFVFEFHFFFFVNHLQSLLLNTRFISLSSKTNETYIINITFNYGITFIKNNLKCFYN